MNQIRKGKKRRTGDGWTVEVARRPYLAWEESKRGLLMDGNGKTQHLVIAQNGRVHPFTELPSCLRFSYKKSAESSEDPHHWSPLSFDSSKTPFFTLCFSHLNTRLSTCNSSSPPSSSPSSPPFLWLLEPPSICRCAMCSFLRSSFQTAGLSGRWARPKLSSGEWSMKADANPSYLPGAQVN